jgi:hypothetical protein
MHFYVNKTLIDIVLVLLFNSERLAKIVVDSPVTSLIYKVAKYFRRREWQMRRGVKNKNPSSNPFHFFSMAISIGGNKCT